MCAESGNSGPRELPRTENGFLDGNLSKFDRRERCSRCLQRNPIGFNVPDPVWERVNALATQQEVGSRSLYPKGVNVPAGPYDILCIGCFVEVADGHGVEWDRDIRFWPVSRYASITAETEALSG